MSGLSSELGNLLSSRRAEIESACSVRGFGDRINALVMLLRGVIRESSVCYVDGELSYYGGKFYERVSEDEVMRQVRNLAVDGTHAL